MENITESHLNHVAGEGNAGLESTRDQDGQQVLHRPTSPGGRSSGRSEPTYPSAPSPDPVSSDEKDFVHTNPPTALILTQESPRDWHKCSSLAGRCHGKDANHAAQYDSAPGTEQSHCACPRPLEPTSESALVVQQGKEEYSGFHTASTVPHDPCGPKTRYQYPPGMYYDVDFPDPRTNVSQYEPCTTPSGLGHTCSAVGKQREENDTYTPNVVIFGESGVGKSSIINLIADQKLADTSNDALGCTFQHQRYPITLASLSFALWDTTGLDEGSEGTVPANVAEKNLKELMGALTRTGGINLIVYCIRGSRLTKALKRNYDLFYVTVCRKKVPVALVVTGLEHQLGGMETWWAKNEVVLERYGMQFDAHACVTTLDVKDPTIQQRRSDSQTHLRELVVEYCLRSSWKADQSFISWVLPLVRGFFRRPSSMGILGNTSIARKVAICGSFPEPMPVRRRSTAQNCNREYQFVQVDKHALRTFSRRMLEDVVGAGVFVFYTSPIVDQQIAPGDIDVLKQFYHIACASEQPCPTIVVLQGCNDEVARTCWSHFTSHHSDIRAQLVSLQNSLDDERTKLDEMIEYLYVDHVEVKSSNWFEKIIDALFGCTL